MVVTRLVLLVLLAGAANASASSYVPGAICDGVDEGGPIGAMLAGAHLRVYDYVWPGFAAKDASAPHGWVGPRGGPDC